MVLAVARSLVNADRFALYPDPLTAEPLWFAAYLQANHEKRVAEQLARRSVEHFLPLYQTVRRWKDRKVRLEVPLFPGYLFVRLGARDRLKVLQVSGVARLVGFDGAPMPLPEREIVALRNSLASGIRAEPHPYLTVGRRVRILSGPFQGQEGILSRKKNRVRVVISLDLILRSISVEIDPAILQPIAPSRTVGKIGIDGMKQASVSISGSEKYRG
jgi:transcription antitermination factor NusG